MKVRQLCSRGVYDPRFDFWKALRGGMQEVHEKGKRLDDVLVGLCSLGLASHRAYFMSSFSVSLAVGIFTSTM